jgi:hypothetical protein
MAVQGFLGRFVMVSFPGKVLFAESEQSPPLWVIDATFFAGQPVVGVDPDDLSMARPQRR